MPSYDRYGHVADAGPTLDRIGNALDRIGAAGWPDLHAALAGYARERRGRLRANELPFEVAGDLLNLADELERLARVLEGKELPSAYAYGKSESPD